MAKQTKMIFPFKNICKEKGNKNKDYLKIHLIQFINKESESEICEGQK